MGQGWAPLPKHSKHKPFNFVVYVCVCVAENSRQLPDAHVHHPRALLEELPFAFFVMYSCDSLMPIIVTCTCRVCNYSLDVIHSIVHVKSKAGSFRSKVMFLFLSICYLTTFIVHTCTSTRHCMCNFRRNNICMKPITTWAKTVL